MNLKLSYIGLTILMHVILFIIGRTAIHQTFSDPSNRARKIRYVLLGLLIWQIYIFAIGSSGILADLSFPPRFAMFLIIPAFIIIGIFINKNKGLAWIQNIPEHWLVFYQSFRILIESLFVVTVAQGLLHPNVTIEGYNYDMVFGFTAVVVGLLFFYKKINRSIVILWNYLGLIVIAFIIFLFTATLYAPQIFGPDTLPFPAGFTKYPYVLVAGFLMPSAVFVHILSIVQLSRSTKE